jgi:hypothetical protein
MRLSNTLESLLRQDRLRWQAIEHVAALGLPDCWVAAGLVRNAVWDCLHGRSASAPTTDIDVIWFDSARAEAMFDLEQEARLRTFDPLSDWSVKNQARMHIKKKRPPYRSCADAMRDWPETATAVGVRLCAGDCLEVLAPWGLDDLFAGILRPPPTYAEDRLPIFRQRVEEKQWMKSWPDLVLVDA